MKDMGTEADQEILSEAKKSIEQKIRNEYEKKDSIRRKSLSMLGGD